MNDVKLYVLAGPANSGKGTKLDRLEELYGKDRFARVSTSSLLKEIKEGDSAIGKKVAYYMDNAMLVPAEIVNEAVSGYLEGLIEAGVKNIILDGYSRNHDQAEYMLVNGLRPARVIELTLPDAVLIERGSDRVCCKRCGATYTKTNPFNRTKVDGVCDKCGGEVVRRMDDSPEKIAFRIESYKNETYPMFKVFVNAGVDVVSIDNTEDDAWEKFIKALDL